MARGRQTDFAVLGVLSVQPMSGYAVREAIRDVLGHFWSESYGQIYPTLAELRRGGLVEAREGTRAGSATYALTPEGRARLVHLLRQPNQPVPPRNGLMLRLFFGRALGADTCRELLRQARADAEQQLAEFRTIRDEIAAGTEHTDQHPYWLLTVSAGEHTARATLSWVEEALATLDEMASDR